MVNSRDIQFDKGSKSKSGIFDKRSKENSYTYVIQWLDSHLFLDSINMMRDMKLAGKVGIITGATSGMGKAMAIRLHTEGARLVLSGRNEQRALEVKDELEARRANSIVSLVGDVGRPETNEALVTAAIDHFGSLDFVITNAGVLGLGKVTELDPADWHATFDTNLHAVFSNPYFNQHFIKLWLSCMEQWDKSTREA